MTTDGDPSDPQPLGERTLCIHGGWRPDPASPSVVPPIVRSATFVTDDEVYARRATGDTQSAPCYTREANPGVQRLEARVASLERAEETRVFASGMAALHAVLSARLVRGRALVVGRELYGGTSALLDALGETHAVEVRAVDVTDHAAVERALEGACLLLCESVSNPLLSVADLPTLAALCHARDAALVVDATFVTPLGQRPLELGADVVVHSASKFLSGHSDVIAGVASGSAAAMEGVLAWRTRAGGSIDPEAAFLVERGMKTLALRLRAQCESTLQIAEAVAAHPQVERVLHPSLATHPTHGVAARDLASFGSMLGLVIRGGDEAALRCLRALRLVLEAPSLGGVETLGSVPAVMSHASLGAEGRAKMGIPPGLLRLSIGIEDPDDLVRDLEQALVRA